MKITNTFGGHGFGKVVIPLATRAAKKDAEAFAGRIKAASRRPKRRAPGAGHSVAGQEVLLVYPCQV
jgi:hypothetical protein